MTFKPIDAKRDEFRKYLERTGVLEAISKVFIQLIHCPNRPDDAIDFICENLGSTLHQNHQIENLQKDLDESRDEIAQLKQIIENMKADKKPTIPIEPNNVLLVGNNCEVPSGPEFIAQVSELEDNLNNLEISDKNALIDNGTKAKENVAADDLTSTKSTLPADNNAKECISTGTEAMVVTAEIVNEPGNDNLKTDTNQIIESNIITSQSVE